MTIEAKAKLNKAYFAHAAALEAFDPHAKELIHAQSAMKRSKSKANKARFAAASDSFESALHLCDAANDAVAVAEDTYEAEIKIAEHRAV